MKKKRTIIFAALVALALGAAGWRLAAPTFAQGGPQAARLVAADESARGRVMITIGTTGDAELPGPDVLGGPILPDILEQAAKALGISRAQLVAEQKAGKSLDELAKAHGTTKQAVMDAIMADMRDQFKQQLEQAVAAGKLSRAQADKLLSTFKLHIEMDDLPRDDGRLDGAPPSRRGLFGFFKGDGRGEGETFTLPVPLPGADGEDWELPPLGLGEDELLIPALPGLNGAGPRIIALAGRGGLDQATFDKVKGVLSAAVSAGQLTQDEADQAIEQLDPEARPAIKVFGWHEDSDDDRDEEQGDDAAKARRGGAASPAQRRLVESL